MGNMQWWCGERSKDENRVKFCHLNKRKLASDMKDRMPMKGRAVLQWILRCGGAACPD